MKRLVLILCLALPGPGVAQEGGDTMRDGAQLFLEGLRDQMAPLIEGLEGAVPEIQGFADSLLPLFEDLLERVDDLSLYETPEVLPNGDIIIRRKPDAPEFAPPGQIDI